MDPDLHHECYQQYTGKPDMMGGRGTTGKPDMMGGRGTSGKPDMVGGVPLVSLI